MTMKDSIHQRISDKTINLPDFKVLQKYELYVWSPIYQKTYDKISYMNRRIRLSLREELMR